MSRVFTHGQRLIMLRESAGLSIKRLAELADITLNTLYQYESERRCLSLKSAIKIGEVLGVSIDDIVGFGAPSLELVNQRYKILDLENKLSIAENKLTELKEILNR